MKSCVSPACGSRKHDKGASTCWWCEAKLVGEDEPEPSVPRYVDSGETFVGYGPLTATNYAPSIPTPAPDTFSTNGFDIHWEDYKPAYTFGELRGEWVAQSQSGHTAIRLPAHVRNVSTPAVRSRVKAETLKKLIALIDGSN